ncbi:FadR family transcriptional regulator [Nonomuraea sp. KC401]|uniref:FadR/GntR family transcriptional regulator n=1 Tax=unclassified Nonomuraea TaxID=2593643 RepID=UPI0010FE72C5|nr:MULTISPECIES: FadR/GntR family transcriptional regulator [unclassified Nonomuraea]NBE93379.1 FCD domain-containing protein [Nonomuraea sp. K271]TLF62670.1 FadR family transcriptional regulator [Nonomuraea sp. KC401]
MPGLTGDAAPLTTPELTARLERAIVSNRWRPGQKLASERQLASEYGVSRPLIREALRSLQERGLIVVQPGRGSFVREVLPTGGPASLNVLVQRGEVTVRELVVARRMLETESAALAATHHDEPDVRRLRDLLTAFDASTDVATAADLDVAFHEAIAAASHNTVLQIMFGAIRPLAHGMMLRSLTDRVTTKIGAPVHHEILAAIEARDPEAARAAMARHVELAKQLYGDDLDRPLPTVLHRWAGDRPDVAALLHRVGDRLADLP